MTRTASRGREVAERRGAPEGGICIFIGPPGDRGGGGDGRDGRDGGDGGDGGEGRLAAIRRPGSPR